MENFKLPRPGTRVRALFDVLCKYPNGIMWKDAKDAYDDAPPAYDRRPFGPRYYSNMGIGKLLRRFATKSGTRGKFVYKLKPEWAEVALKNPFYCVATKVDEGKLRILAAEILEGLDELKELKVGDPDKTFEAISNPDGILPGDWVAVKEPNSEASRPLRANGIGSGNYQVQKIERGYIWLHGCNGGWEPRRFKIVVRPTANQPGPSGPKNDKGAPEIRDMGWSTPRVEHNPFAHVYVEQVTKHNTELQAKVANLQDELQTLSKELLNCEKNMNEYKDRVDYLMDKTATWDDRVQEAREQLGRLQHAEVGQVYTMCDDLDSFLCTLLEDIRNT